MARNELTTLSAAFELLLEEFEAEVEFWNHKGAQAFDQSDYDVIAEIREQARLVAGFRGRLDTLRREWSQCCEESVDLDVEERARRRDLSRLRRGLRTPEDVFRTPILQAIEDLGGKAECNDVLDRVKTFLAASLKEADLEPLTSNPEQPRWRNAALWARFGLVRDGLLRNDSPQGVWELSDAGRRFLNVEARELVESRA